jgi:hypothetical protein
MQLDADADPGDGGRDKLRNQVLSLRLKKKPGFCCLGKCP